MKKAILFFVFIILLIAAIFVTDWQIKQAEKREYNRKYGNIEFPENVEPESEEGQKLLDLQKRFGVDINELAEKNR